MPYLRMQRLGICGPAVRQRPRHLPRYETARPQDMLLASVVHKRIVLYHAAEDIAPWVWSGYPPPHERGRSPMTQNPSHPALGSRCFSGSHAHRKPLAQTPSFVLRRASQGKPSAHASRMERSRLPRGMWGCLCVASMPRLASAARMQASLWEACRGQRRFPCR